MEGVTLAGKYRLRSVLGTGGAGFVYEAEQLDLHRTVAVKLLRHDRPHIGVERFEIEARAASRINHPNAIAIYDFGVSDDGAPYLVMEHLRGRTLTDAIDTELALVRVVSIAAQILSALDEAHACGVVHRDLKSDNIILERLSNGDDFVKVIDFGLALVGGLEAEESGIYGTPEYMAPEQIRNEPTGPTADLYAVGIILYEMIVGRTPFAGGNTRSVLRGHLDRLAPRADAVIPTCPAAMADIIERALAKNPAERWSSAEDMRGALLALPSRLVGADHAVRCLGCGGDNVASHRYCAHCGVSLVETRRGAVVEHRRPRGKGRSRTQAALARTSRIQAAPHERGVFVGRVAELQQLAQFYAGGAASATTAIVGPTGAGKARLALEAGRRASDTCTTFFAGADPSGLRSAWYPILSMLEAVMGLCPEPSIDDLNTAVAACGLPDRDVPGLAELFAIRGPLDSVELAVRRREARAAALRALSSTHRRYPRCVLCFADIDRYDRPSIELITALAVALDGSGVRVVVTAGDRRHAPAGAQVVELGPMDPTEAHALATTLAGGGPVPSSDELQACTGGWPAAVESVVAWVRLGHAPATAPAELVDLVSSLLCRLPAAARRQLQAVAVHGAVASIDLVDRTLGRDEAPGPEVFAELDRARLLCVDVDELRIPSDLIAGAVYATTPADVRRKLHRQAVAAYRALGRTTSPGVIAHHADAGGLNALAYIEMMAAGEDAVRRFDDRGAAEWYSRATTAARRLLADGEQTATAQLVDASVQLADVLRFTGELGLAEGTLDEAELMQPPPAQMAVILRARGRLAVTEQRTDDGCTAFERAIGLALRAGDWALVCDTYIDLAGALANRGDPARAVQQLAEGIDVLTMGEGLGSDTTMGQLWRLGFRLAELHLRAGQARRAADVATRSLLHVDTQRSPQGRGRLFALLGDIFATTGQAKEALAYRARAIDELRRVGDRRSTAELLLENARESMRVPARAGRSFDAAAASATRIAHDLAAEIGWREGVAQAAEVEARRILT